MSNMPGNFETPTIIGADAELQAKLLAQLSEKREIKARQPQISGSKMNSFANNQRRSNRYEISTPVVCFPVLQSREVSSDYSMIGVAADIGTNGMKLILEGSQPNLGLELVIGVEQKNGKYQYCAGTVASSRKVSPTTSEVGVQFCGYMYEVFESELLFPVLDPMTMKYTLPYPDSVMASICKIGGAVSIRLDSVLTCPSCGGIPTVRYGCAHCHSTNVSASTMIHHFACANVDFVERFEIGDELMCQKCRTRGMVVGSDYEYLDGPNTCSDCGEANLEKIQIGHCMSCENRFAFESAVEMEIIGYSVNKLDILVFIDTAQ